MTLCECEVKVLRECNGEPQQGLAWGAAMGQSLEVLHGAGLVERSDGVYTSTQKGREYLASLP